MMKKILFNTALAVAVALMAAGCKAFRTVGSEHTATGNPYEVIVVCAQPQWQSELGDTLQAVLRQPVAELPKFEPMFNVMRILPNNFKSLVERHRNIVSVVVRDDIKEPSISVRYDVTAKPQVFVTIKGPDNRSTADYVARNQDNLLYVLEKAERDRSVAYPLSPKQIEDYELRPARDNPDIKERMSVQAQAVGAWERRNHIPEEKRLTRWDPDSKTYEPLDSVRMEELQRQFEIALEFPTVPSRDRKKPSPQRGER